MVEAGFANINITCENPDKVCNKHTECIRDCNNRGVCLNSGKCECFFPYEGDACGTFKGCPSGLSEDICNTLLETNYYTKTELPNSGVGILSILTIIMLSLVPSLS